MITFQCKEQFLKRSTYAAHPGQRRARRSKAEVLYQLYGLAQNSLIRERVFIPDHVITRLAERFEIKDLNYEMLMYLITASKVEFKIGLPPTGGKHLYLMSEQFNLSFALEREKRPNWGYEFVIKTALYLKPHISKSITDLSYIIDKEVRPSICRPKVIPDFIFKNGEFRFYLVDKEGVQRGLKIKCVRRTPEQILAIINEGFEGRTKFEKIGETLYNRLIRDFPDRELDPSHLRVNIKNWYIESGLKEMAIEKIKGVK